RATRSDRPAFHEPIGQSLRIHAFFFQAEDGIRDKLVTGVQTCALPILHPPPTRPCRKRRPGPPPGGCPAGGCSRSNRRRCAGPRSEERRVGKECRTRWAAEAEKKKEVHDDIWLLRCME